MFYRRGTALKNHQSLLQEQHVVVLAVAIMQKSYALLMAHRGDKPRPALVRCGLCSVVTSMSRLHAVLQVGHIHRLLPYVYSFLRLFSWRNPQSQLYLAYLPTRPQIPRAGLGSGGVLTPPQPALTEGYNTSSTEVRPPTRWNFVSHVVGRCGAESSGFPAVCV